MACNYELHATDAGYCDYADSGYDCAGVCLNDEDQDGICDEFEVAGCTDNTACNFSNAATDNDGSCSYADAGYDCAGNCLVDSDGDGTCDQDEVSGCQDDMACNYDASATDAGYCDYADSGYDCAGVCLNDEDQDGICDEFESRGLHGQHGLQLQQCSNGQRRTHAAMLTLVTTAQATAWWIATAMARVIKTK